MDREDDITGPSSPGPDRSALMLVAGIHAIALVLSLVFLALGAGVGGRERSDAFIALGVVGVLLVLTTAPLALLMAQRAASKLEQKVDDLNSAIRMLAEQALLSDDARRVLNRQTERQMLRRAIEADIDAGDWEAGLVLCRELADRFGYRADAEELRARIEEKRSTSLDEEVREGIAVVDGLLLQRRFDDAAREAARLARLHSEEPRLAALPRRVADSRGVYKSDLLARFRESVEQDSPAVAMAALRELDSYLSPTEAAEVRETARGVINRYREHLGTQFRHAVEDRDWADAANLGRQIISEFPNSKMAAEVRQLLDGILANANAAPGRGAV
jgi:hypothetical protein